MRNGKNKAKKQAARATLATRIRKAKGLSEKIQLSVFGRDQGEPEVPAIASFYKFSACVESPVKVDREQVSNDFRRKLEGLFVEAIRNLDVDFFDRVRSTILALKQEAQTINCADNVRTDMIQALTWANLAKARPDFKNKLKRSGRPVPPFTISDLLEMFPMHSETQIRRAAEDVGLRIAKAKPGPKINNI